MNGRMRSEALQIVVLHHLISYVKRLQRQFLGMAMTDQACRGRRTEEKQRFKDLNLQGNLGCLISGIDENVRKRNGL